MEGRSTIWQLWSCAAHRNLLPFDTHANATERPSGSSHTNKNAAQCSHTHRRWAQLFNTNAGMKIAKSFTVVTGVYFWSVNEINEKKKLLAATPNSTFTRHVRYSPVSTQRRHISRLTSSRPRARRPDKCVVDSFDVVVLVLARAGAPTDMTVVWALCRHVSVRSHCAGAHLHSAPSPTPSTPPSLSSTPNSGSSRRHSHSSRAAANHTSG